MTHWGRCSSAPIVPYSCGFCPLAWISCFCRNWRLFQWGTRHIGGAAGPAGPAMAGPVLLTVPHPLLLTVPHPLISWVIINANVCFIFVDIPFSVLWEWQVQVVVTLYRLLLAEPLDRHQSPANLTNLVLFHFQSGLLERRLWHTDHFSQHGSLLGNGFTIRK